MLQRGLNKATTELQLVVPVMICTIAFWMAGCNMVSDLPGVGPDGKIAGGEPRLSALIEMISKGRPRAAAEGPECVGYVISVYPVKHLTVVEGDIPATRDAVAAVYTFVVSVESGKSAEVAVITETVPAPGQRPANRHSSQVFRWENGHWVPRSLGELQIQPPL